MEEKKKFVMLGSAHPLRGGLASYNERLTREFQKLGWDSRIYTFSLQYPGFLFPGTSQYSTEPKPADLNIFVKVNSINPLNWIRVGREIKKLKPDILIVKFWLPFMGPCLGTICRIVRKNKFTKVIAITDNVFPHEKRPGDNLLIKYFLNSVDGFITMSEKVLADLQSFALNKPEKYVPHPLFDNFGEKVEEKEAREILHLNPSDKIILFFGFIRKYKGLDILLQAMTNPAIRNSGIKLLVAGEFYDDPKPYLEIIEKENLSESVILKTDFIQDSEVKYYLSAANCVVQPYIHATQSGVTPLAYHFEKPMIVTNVGGLPALVPDGKVGLVAEPDPSAIAQSILRFFELGEDYFIPHLQKEKEKYSWNNIVQAAQEIARESRASHNN
ncbi:MAG: glycosyl transferase family 1 [Bacteroidetes bacterium]|nr:MAG: glycosyl transferase family 1 [Bacteroidota bacterium]